MIVLLGVAIAYWCATLNILPHQSKVIHESLEGSSYKQLTASQGAVLCYRAGCQNTPSVPSLVYNSKSYLEVGQTDGFVLSPYVEIAYYASKLHSNSGAPLRSYFLVGMNAFAMLAIGLTLFVAPILVPASRLSVFSAYNRLFTNLASKMGLKRFKHGQDQGFDVSMPKNS